MLPAHAISIKNVAEKQFLKFHQVLQQKLIEMLKKSLVNLCTCLKSGLDPSLFKATVSWLQKNYTVGVGVIKYIVYFEFQSQELREIKITHQRD